MEVKAVTRPVTTRNGSRYKGTGLRLVRCAFTLEAGRARGGMADAPDLGSGSERIGGSSPLARTTVAAKVKKRLEVITKPSRSRCPLRPCDTGSGVLELRQCEAEELHVGGHGQNDLIVGADFHRRVRQRYPIGSGR